MLKHRGARTALLLCIIGALLALGVRVAFDDPHYPPWRVVVEALVIIGGVQLFAHLEPVRIALAGATKPLRVVLWALLFLTVFGHLSKFSKLSFPFAAWDMYDIPAGTTTLYRYYVHTDEEAFELSGPELYPALGSFRLSSTMTELAARATLPETELPPEIDREESVRDFEALLSALAVAFERRTSNEAVRMWVDRCELDADELTKLSCTPVYWLDL